MEESERVPQFMQGLLVQAPGKQVRIGWQSVPLVFQPVIGDDGDRSPQFRLPEDKGQNGNEEIVGNDGQECCFIRCMGGRMPVYGGGMVLDMLEDGRGVVLTPPLIVEESKVDLVFTHLNGNVKRFPECRYQTGQEPPVRVPERQHGEELHCPRFNPYLSILWYSVTLSIPRIVALRLIFHPVSWRTCST
jgi:hypothetical protein